MRYPQVQQLSSEYQGLVQPVLARAHATLDRNDPLHDPKAVQIAVALGWEPAKSDRHSSPVGTAMFDEEVATFLLLHPEGTVVQLGVGLSTRFERLDNGRAHWLELDSPDKIHLRRRMFDDCERRKIVAADLQHAQWHALLEEHPGPYCFVSERHLLSQSPKNARAVFLELSRAYPGSWLILDTLSDQAPNAVRNHAFPGLMATAPGVHWYCSDPRHFAQKSAIVDRSRSLLDSANAVMPTLPLWRRVVHRLFPSLLRKNFEGYRISRLVFQA